MLHPGRRLERLGGGWRVFGDGEGKGRNKFEFVLVYYWDDGVGGGEATDALECMGKITEGFLGTSVVS